MEKGLRTKMTIPACNLGIMAYCIAIDEKSVNQQHKIHKGEEMGYTEDMMKYDLLTATQEQELALRVQRGDLEALHALVCANLRLVAKIAQDYKNHGVDIEDLIQAGNLGLIQATERYKPGTGARFETFAHQYIRHSIKEVLSRMSCAVSMSIGAYGKHREAVDTLKKLGGDATGEQVAQKLGCKKRTDMVAIIRGGGVKVSLNDKVDDKRTYLDVIEDENACNVMDSIIHDEQLEMMMKSLSCLDVEERYVIDNLFGLNGDGRKTLREIGDVLGKTAEWVRQLKEKALEKMRFEMARME